METSANRSPIVLWGQSVFSQLRKLRKLQIFSLLFVISLSICLGLGYRSAWGQEPPVQPLPHTRSTNLNPQVSQVSASAAQLVEQGVTRYGNGDFEGAIAVWQQALNQYRSQPNGDLSSEAIVLENLARTYQTIGRTQEALEHWEQAIDRYRQLDNGQQMGRMMTEQAQIYSRLGQYRQAIALLCGSLEQQTSCMANSALALARQHQDTLGEVAALGSLGEAHRLMGNYDEADRFLRLGLEVAESQPSALVALLNSLGNTHVNLAQTSYRQAWSAEQIGDTTKASELRQKGLQEDRIALQYFQRSSTLAQQQPEVALSFKALMDSIPSRYRLAAPEAAPETVTPSAQTVLQQAIQMLNQLPDSQDKVFAAIDLTRFLHPLSPEQGISRVECLEATTREQAASLLNQAVQVAQRIGDRRSQSFALGELGHLYECQGDFSRATELTQQARLAAEKDPDSLYLWEWQTGRILEKQRKPDEAIDLYERAITTLNTIRSDILTAKRDIQFDFRDTIEPIYRQLIKLRLARTPNSELLSVSYSNKDNLNSAIKTLDSLKLAELQNYFGDDCTITAINPGGLDFANQNQTKNETTAVFNSVILEDRTAIIASFPNGQQQLQWLDLKRDTLIEEINAYRRELERFFDAEVGYQSERSQRLYDQMIRPFIPNLQKAQITTLIFVHDGILRSVPMGSLVDREDQKFLIQKYAIATTPSLTLTNPQPIDREKLRALALGLTQSATVDGQPFPALENVSIEIQGVAAELPGSKPLFDQEFTRSRLEQELTDNAYSVIHVATHGQFGTEPEDTFLITGDAGQANKLTLNVLDSILRSASLNTTLELLSLTACQTAVGDDRAALGLAGVAAQAGAKSVLASLWFIDDAATAQLITDFYSNLRTGSSKAQALQAAQRSLIENGIDGDRTYSHPAYWASFVLIGNWL